LFILHLGDYNLKLCINNRPVLWILFLMYTLRILIPNCSGLSVPTLKICFRLVYLIIYLIIYFAKCFKINYHLRSCEYGLIRVLMDMVVAFIMFDLLGETIVAASSNVLCLLKSLSINLKFYEIFKIRSRIFFSFRNLYFKGMVLVVFSGAVKTEGGASYLAFT
jgi:hypothetical protein